MWLPKINSTNKPKYLAIAEALEADIRAGKLVPGGQLPPQRELADLLNVNVSTISRAYREAERRGLISGTVGRGTFVAADAAVTREMMGAGGIRQNFIEMGVVVPLYHQDPDLMERLSLLQKKGDLSRYLRYTDPAGMPEHRQIGAEWVRRFGIETFPDRVTVTAGAQHGLACILAACFKPGDRIAVDALTYPGIKTLAAMMHIRLVPVAMDEQGMIPEALETASRRDQLSGIYLMPAVQNPTGSSMGAQRRQEIVAIILRHQLMLIEDDAYWFTADAPFPALSSLVPSNSIYVAGLSKMLFAGLRTAFVVAMPELQVRLAAAVLNTLWMAPTLNCMIVCEAILDGTVDRIIGHKLKEAKVRNGMAAETLPRPLKKTNESGFFLWYQLPEPWTGRAFEEQARIREVNVFCSEKFVVGNSEVAPAIRIALTGPETRQNLAEGLRRIVEILKGGYWLSEGIF